MFVSHEALLLEYEEALVRHLKNPLTEQPLPYATSGHFLWIGDRTRQLDGAHVEFFRGIANPIGIKCGPSLQPQELAELLDKLDPNYEPGRISLIARYGSSKVEQCLPGHIEAVKKSGHPVIWVCDPMHGNTHTAGQFMALSSRGQVFWADSYHRERRQNSTHLSVLLNLIGFDDLG